MILNRRFFAEKNEKEAAAFPRQEVDDTCHFFLSHAQSEASGSVKDLYYVAKRFGMSSWLDMKERHINVEAMTSGVENCHTFIACLTASYFLRPFCLFELFQAMKNKKISLR